MPIGFDATASGFSLRQLDKHQSALSRLSQRLGSGQRINGAADDAASLGISEGLRAEVRSIAPALRTARKGEAMMGMADSTLGSISSILVRMRELAVQAADGAVSDDGRSFIQTEFGQMR